MGHEQEGHVDHLESLCAHADGKHDGEVIAIEDVNWIVKRPACSAQAFLLGYFRTQPNRRRDHQMVVCRRWMNSTGEVPVS